MSLSARRAWIEMQVFQRIAKPFRVALRKESVDRNSSRIARRQSRVVALRKESVDRNDTVQVVIVIMHVALRKESVDRNVIRIAPINSVSRSLSARRAWIEIALLSR